MKTGILASPTIAAESMQGSVMGMSAKGMDIASYFLRDKIYSDKVLAVVREYISNAVDEHRKHSISRPVEVKLGLDDDGNWYWSVRDFAKGLDDHGVRNIFGMYFESTKSGDNDSIGGFGIGSKAGLCYADMFSITSYHDGLVTAYVCSLGGGNKGIPVGEIYDISKDITSESGIEIRIPVQVNDTYKFENATRGIVANFTTDVAIRFETTYTGITEVCEPFIPSKTVDLPGGYKLSEYTNDGSSSQVKIRMGGIVYATRNLYNFNSSELGPIGRHVVDVPIGKLTLPISREAIETTPANDKVIADIKAALVAFMEEDKKTITPPKLGELLDNSSSGGDYNHYSYYSGPTVKGEWFAYKGRIAFPDTYRLLDTVSRSSYNKLPRSSNGNHTVFHYPDIKNPNGWIERLEIGLKDTPGYVGHFTARNTKRFQELITNPNVDVSDVDFIDVKALKLPPLPKKEKSQVKYLVYMSGYRQGSYTPEELNDFVNSKYGEVDLESNWWETVETITEVSRRTVETNKRGSYGQSHYTVNSIKMAEALYDMGWLSPNDQEYKDALDRISKAEDLKHRKQNTEPTLKAHYFDTKIHPHVIQALIKDPTKLERLINVKNKILTEDSTRGRILRKLVNLGGYGTDRKIDRHDLRQIMTLK